MCAALMKRVNEAFETRACVLPAGSSELAVSVHSSCRDDDFKLIITADELLTCVGHAAYASMMAALGLHESDVPDAVVLRRTTGTGRWINFHTDKALRTVQVPLAHDDACVGGRLVFALSDGSLQSPVRRPGVLLSHHGDVVHGVTQLLEGRRYGLFVLRARTA